MARTLYLVGGLGLAAALFAVSQTQTGRALAADGVGLLVNALTPRGIRNNNPGNIEWIDNPVRRWRGMVGQDGRYGVFDTAANGVRAIGGELKASYRKGQNTIAAIIAEWAPATENDTGAYARHVAAQLGVDATQRLNVLDLLPEFTAAIIRHENGQQPYPIEDIATWVNS